MSILLLYYTLTYYLFNGISPFPISMPEVIASILGIFIAEVIITISVLCFKL